EATIALMNDEDSTGYVTSPFDIFDDFNYEENGHWINSGWNADEFAAPTKVKVTIVYSDATAEKSKDGFTVNITEAITLHLVNDAETAEEMDAPLLKLAEIDNNGYLNVPK